MKIKKGSQNPIGQMIVSLIIIGFVAVIFMFGIVRKLDDRGVKQDLAEKQTALLIEASLPNTNIIIYKKNFGMTVSSVKIKDGKIFIDLDGLISLKGTSFISNNHVLVMEEEKQFRIVIK